MSDIKAFHAHVPPGKPESADHAATVLVSRLGDDIMIAPASGALIYLPMAEARRLAAYIEGLVSEERPMNSDWWTIDSLDQWLDSRPGDDTLFEVAWFRADKLMWVQVLVVRDVVVLPDMATHWRPL